MSPLEDAKFHLLNMYSPVRGEYNIQEIFHFSHRLSWTRLTTFCRDSYLWKNARHDKFGINILSAERQLMIRQSQKYYGAVSPQGL